MDKKMFLNERGMKNINDSGIIKGTRIICKVPGTDKVLWETENKVLAPGSAWIASQHFDFGKDSTKTPKPATTNYNDAFASLGAQGVKLDNSVDKSTAPTTPRRIYLFCMGTDGCGLTSAQQYEVDYTKWLRPEDMIPFRYTDALLDNETAIKYGGRRTTVVDGRNKYAYYFKTFETEPLWIQEYIGDSNSISSMYTNSITAPMQSYVELKLLINATEGREWWKANDIRDGHINTISLVQGWYTTVGEGEGLKYYQDLHPVTKLNFPTELMTDPTKGLDITYHIFY